jgi:hypothetical protein
MATFAILGSIAVGGLLAAIAYCICRNEIVRIKELKSERIAKVIALSPLQTRFEPRVLGSLGG